MIVVLPFCEKDANAAIDLLDWIKLLGGCSTDCLLVTDAATQWSICTSLLNAANDAFLKADLITTEEPVSGWAQGANSLWIKASEECKKRKVSWLFLEPDAIPLKPGWFDAIATEYASTTKPYMGYIYAGKTPGLPQRFMTGVAVYPASAYDEIGFHARGDKAWDVAAAKHMVDHGEDTNLIFQIWGEEGKPPTFAKQNVPHTNILCPEQIPVNAVLFHRNKDGTLIELLRDKLFPARNAFITVIAFCNHDGHTMLKNVRWMSEIGTKKKYDCLLSFDETTSKALVKSIKDSAAKSFVNVDQFEYPTPPLHHWPFAPNWAFRNTAMHILNNVKRPWLWLEYDEIPVKPEWLDVLQDEYHSCNRPFMGNVIIEYGGHMNGGGIYPYDCPYYIPKALSQYTVAWDYEMRHEMMGHCHQANHLIQQVTAFDNGRISHNGTPPTFRSRADVRLLVDPSAVLFHRCKDGTLIDRLREMKQGRG